MKAAKAIPELTEKDKARFLSKVDRQGPTQPHMDTACWEWTAGKSKGYGNFWLGRTFSAHRIAYFLAAGADPGELQVNHRCDNPACCNAEHFFLDDHLANMRDRDAKGRQRRGDNHPNRLHPERLARGDNHGSRLHPERMPCGDKNGARTKPEKVPRGEMNGMAKLTAADIPIIRADQRFHRIIAVDYGVSQVLISLIKRRQSWKHIA